MNGIVSHRVEHWGPVGFEEVVIANTKEGEEIGSPIGGFEGDVDNVIGNRTYMITDRVPVRAEELSEEG